MRILKSRPSLIRHEILSMLATGHSPLAVPTDFGFSWDNDAVNASVVLTDPDGVEHLMPMTCTNPGLNTWVARVSADRTGWWSYRVEGWSDPYGTWEHDATIKVQAVVPMENP